MNKIIEYTDELSLEDFLQNTLIQDACIRQFEIIGEATKRISAKTRNSYPNVPWADMAGMRDKLIHDYIDVDLFIVWKTVKDDIAPLLIEVEQILDQMNRPSK